MCSFSIFSGHCTTILKHSLKAVCTQSVQWRSTHFYAYCTVHGDMTAVGCWVYIQFNNRTLCHPSRVPSHYHKTLNIERNKRTYQQIKISINTDTDISTYYTDVGLGCLDYEFPRVYCVMRVMGSIKLCVSWSCSVITSLIESWYFPPIPPSLHWQEKLHRWWRCAK